MTTLPKMTAWQTFNKVIKYTDALDMMEEQLGHVINGEESDTIYLLEHDHVYTAGTSAKDSELLTNNKNIPVIHVGRGGKYTYHGPGQRIIYPIIDLRKKERGRDLKLYVRQLEDWIIATLGYFELECYIIPGKVGIWTDIKNSSTQTENTRVPAKIGAIGIRVRKWVTYHGIAVNISNDLDMYRGIIPCGISDFPVTSMHALGKTISMIDFDLALKQEYKKIFE